MCHLTCFLEQFPITVNHFAIYANHFFTFLTKNCTDCCCKGISYRVRPLNISAGDQFKPDYLEISPNNAMDVDPQLKLPNEKLKHP